MAQFFPLTTFTESPEAATHFLVFPEQIVSSVKFHISHWQHTGWGDLQSRKAERVKGEGEEGAKSPPLGLCSTAVLFLPEETCRLIDPGSELRLEL